jgi:hypothetical protein
MTILTDIIKYFAKFPDTTGIMKNFSRTTSQEAGYDTLKTYMSGLTSPLLPQIKDYIFGQDETIVTNRVRTMKDYFLFVEYGRIQISAPDHVRVRDGSLFLAFTVAKPFNNAGRDSAEELIISDACLDLVMQILQTIKDDDEVTCPINRYLDSTIELSPVIPELFYQNIGWVVTFSKNNIQLI